MLRSIRFSVGHSTVDQELDLRERRIMFEISDGEQWSAPAFATITIVPVNDNHPTISLTPFGEVRVQLLADGFCEFGLRWSHAGICGGISRKCSVAAGT